MKKFAKILGFLGFFVTVATAQIGTAWAVLCNPGQYLPAGSDQCAECPGTKSIDGINQGVYCPYAQNYKEKAPEDQGLSPCRPVCGTNNYWLTTRESAAEADACTGTCSGFCIRPDDCLEANGCFPIIETVSGTLSCGDTECHISEECKTKTCDDYCYVPSSDGETCVPKTNKAPQYRCSLDEQAVYFGIDATYGQPYTVTGSANLCVAPSNNQEFAGWILTNDDYSGPYMPGTSSGTIASWPCVNDPVIFIPSWTGICLEVIFDENGGTSPSGGHNKLYKIDGETGNKWYEAGCKKQVDNPQVEGKPTKNNATFVGYYGPSPSEIYVFEPYSTGDYSTLVSNNNWVATSNRHTLYAHFICNTGYHPVNGVCVENSYDITYICNNGTNQYTATDTINFNDSYKVNGLVGNPILPVGNDANVQCTPPAGNVFTGWWFNLSLQGYDNHAPIERWTWDNDGTFTATWGKGEFEITLDPTTGAWNSNVPDEQRKLYTIYSDGVYITSAREPGDQMTSTENPLNRIPEKTATVTFKYCDGDSCNNPTHPDTEQDVEIAFKGFYQGVNSGSQYISLDQNAQRWYITPQGDWDGKYYTSSKTWYAQWANGSVTLPTIPSDFWPGHTFLGWFTEETGGTEITSPYAVTDSITLYAHWDVSCFRVSFDDETNGGQSTNGGNPDLYKSLNDTNWYNNDTCSGDPMSLSDVVARYLPVSLDPHAHFAQYNTRSNGTGWEIFNAAGKLTDGNNGGTSESNGTIWEINQNTTLFAIYDCDEYYEPGDNGTCVGKSYDVTYVCNNDEGETAVHEDGATYGNAYRVNRYGVNSTTKIIECEIPNGHTFDGWLLNCDDELYDDGVKIERWTCTNNPTFTAKWAKKNFEITLNPNGGSWNDATQEQQTLYTTFDTAVYRDSLRQEVMTWNNNELKPIPTKTINISIYANSPDQSGATFEWNGTTVSQVVNDPQNLGLSGFYETTNSETALISYNSNKTGWYITETPNGGGVSVGIGYDGTDAPYKWYAHWGTYELTLPSTATWAGYDFAGWTCDNGYQWTPESNSSPVVTNISENITCTAQWVVACRTVTFNENGGTPNAQYGTYDTRSKVVGTPTWYTNSTCGGGILVPNVSDNIPTRGEHEHFVGYNTASDGTGDEIFDEDGALVDSNWTITQNATLYAQYACDEPYHNDPTTGECVACPQGTFYNPGSTTNPSTYCDSCDDYIKAKAREWNMEWALDYTWSSNPPYTWSVDQCYRECRGEGSNEVDTCDIFQLTSNDMNNRMEQFLPDELINSGGDTGKQISFFGNQRVNINTCSRGTGTRYCPVGLLGEAAIATIKPIAAPVDFHIDPTNTNETKSVYIVGGRNPSLAGGLVFQNGYAWSQVRGPGQNSPQVNHVVDGQQITFNYIHIIYPAEAPQTTNNPACSTFTGYGYPQSHPAVSTSGLDLTTINAADIIGHALDINTSPNSDVNMSPIVSDSTSRNLYAQYDTGAQYNYSYNCNCSGDDCGGSAPSGGTICAGAEFTPATNTCTKGNCTFLGWSTNPGATVPETLPTTWTYTSNQVFYAIWGNCSAPTANIEYYSGNTLFGQVPLTVTPTNSTIYGTLQLPTVPAIDQNMPATYNCDGATFNIPQQVQYVINNNTYSGVPVFIDPETSQPIGEVVKWCTDPDLETGCYLPYELNPANCNDVKLYAQWKCAQGYMLQDNRCVRCQDDYIWNSTTQQCEPATTGCPSGFPHTKTGYNWGTDQCYRICGSQTGDTRTDCRMTTDIPSGHGFEQFLTGTQVEKQISFYGNENDGIYTCQENTGAAYCPLGLLNGVNIYSAHKPMSAPVKFNGSDDQNIERYIIGNRNASANNISLGDGFAWSHVVGHGQQGSVIEGANTYRYTFITYPTDTAPTAVSREHYTFLGYGYPEDNPEITPVLANLALTTGSNGNAASIISYANSHSGDSNMSPVINEHRNLYAQYTADTTYTLRYDCGDGDTGTAPNSQSGIYLNQYINVAEPSGCSHWGNTNFLGWLAQPAGGNYVQPTNNNDFEWTYTESQTFVAQWGGANTHNINYNKIPSPAQLLQSGNTLVDYPDETTMPTTFTCGAGTTPISGQPKLQNSGGTVVGVVVEWCDNNGLTDGCATPSTPKTVSNTPCEDKNVYAKWECADGYHLNADGDDCITCGAGYYWNNGDCAPCESGWTSRPPYNWTINQCYKLCDGRNGTAAKTCSDSLTPTLSTLPYFANKFLDQGDDPYQITFYGNDDAGIDVCTMDDVAYCPAVLSALAANTLPVNKTKASQITFKKKGNNADAGKRYLVGFLDINGDYVTQNGKFWSHIAGPGQQITEGVDTYTKIIYPTNIAPAPSDTINDPLFTGYYDAQSGGNQRVDETLGLSSSNAVAFAQGTLLENKVGSRTLYPQYCETGQTWNGSTCTYQEWTVKYECGPSTHGYMNTNYSNPTNTATYNQSYTVAQSGGNVIAECIARTGYVVKLNANEKPIWKLNDSGAHLHFTGENINWSYTTFDPEDTPIFTAQYDCASGYTWQDGECKPGAGLCDAHLPTNPDPHATMTTGWNAVDGCVYTITCDPCNETTNHSCYTYTGMDANGQFIITGAVGDAGAHVLDNVFCTPSTYTVYYRCNDNASPTADTTSAVYGEDYTIRTNGYSAGDILNCTSGTGQFNGWTFNGGSNPDQLYEGGAPLLWTYYNLSPYPLFTAHYGQCDEGQVLINGFCETCTCPQSNWTPTGAVQSCDARPLTDDSCQAAVTCNEPYGNPQWSCDGAVCSASCSTCPDNQVSVGGVCYDTCTASCDAPSTDNGCPVSGYPTFVTCSYDVQSVGGYDTGDGRCRYIDGANAGQVIDLGACSMTGVTCNDTNYDWNGDSHACERTANYTCGNHGSSTYPMSNIVQYGQNYVVAYKDGTQIAGCTQVDTGYTFIDKWTLNTAPLNTGGFGTGNTIWWGSGGQTYFTNSQSPLFTAMYSCATGYYEPVPDTCCDIATTYWNSSTQQCETCPNGYHPNSNNTDCDPDGPTPDQYHRIALDRNGGTLSGENSAPVNLYTIEDDNVYSDPQRNNPFTELTSNPTKYSPVTFNYCNQNSTTNCSGSQTDSRDAYFEFKGFYDSYNEKTIDESNPGRLNSYGFTQAIGYTGTADPIATWYAHWSDHSSIAQDQWFTLSDDVRPGYSFLRWTSQPNCAGNTVSYTQNNSFTGSPSNDVVYACWERTSCPDDEILIGTDCKKKCWVGCTWTGAPTNPTACPSNIANIPDVVNCTYDSTSPVPQGPGYLQFPESTQCLDVATNQLITPYSPCDYTVNCTPPKVWNPSTSSCVYPSGTLWNVKFVCDINGSLVQEYNVSVNGTINVPGNSTDVCANTGYSFTNWKDTAHPSASLVAGANNVPWTHEYNATYIPDWNDGNVYHVTLDQNDATTAGSIEDLYEKYGTGWGYGETGPWSNSIILSGNQLPRKTNFTFGGYKNEYGQTMGEFNSTNSTWTTPTYTTITSNQTWTPIWNQCVDPYFYYDETSGLCKECESAYHDNPVPITHEGCYRICSESCQPDVSVCDIPNAATYTLVTDTTYPGELHYPGNNGCQLYIWLPATSGTVPNCQCRVATCETGYHVNADNTACLPDTHIITLNSHIDGFNGHVSSPTVLYTKYDHGAYLESSYIRLMGTNGENPLDSIPEKSANVVLYGNGGTFAWNGYPVQQATATANFAFQGFYASEYASTPYIASTGLITPSGDAAAKQNQSDSTVWHAQWQNGSITLPTPQRQCYDFDSWWTAQYDGTWVGNGGMTYSPSIAQTYLYAHWTAGTYNITYHNGNTIYSGCYQTSYTYGNSITINCLINPPSGSHQIFKGWCTNSDLTQGCAQNPTISTTDCGDKDYYAWWGCDDGYTWNGTGCVANQYTNVKYICNNGFGQTYDDPHTATFGNSYHVYGYNESNPGPNCTIPSGKTFGNWLLNTTPDATPVNGDTNITWQWTMSNPTFTANWIDNLSECPATLSDTSHTTLISVEYNPQTRECSYNIQCDPCNPLRAASNYSCYTYNTSASTGGAFTITGAAGNSNALDSVVCTPTQYSVYYRCDSTATPIAAGTKAIYGETYYVESNPHNNYVGTQLSCPEQQDDQIFTGWKFNRDSSNTVYYPGTDHSVIDPWLYYEDTPQPIFTAEYGDCQPGYIPVDGECKKECTVDCTWPNYPADPAPCPTPLYPAGTMCHYIAGTNPAYGYRPNPSSRQCLDVDTGNPVEADQCAVSGDPISYYVTLDSNGGIEGPGFVNKLYEQYGYGWSTTNGNFDPDLVLGTNELPTSSEECKVFVGYFTASSGGQQRIQQNGWVSQNGYNSLPPTTLTNDNVKWYAHYDYDTSREYTIRFRCSANGGDIYSYTVHMGDANLTAPAATVCSGVAFDKWKGSAHPEILLDAGSYFAWDHCFNEIFVPDAKAKYHVNLIANGGVFPSNEYQELWYAVDMGWYKNEGLTTPITYIPGAYLPTKQGSNFNGWLDSATQAPRGTFSGANWVLPTNGISTNETWDAQWGPCEPDEFWDSNSGTCKSCREATNGEFPHALLNATSINQCYDSCDEECNWNSLIEATCSIPHATHPYDHYTVVYPGKHFYGRDYCSLDIWSSNSHGIIPNCECKIKDCEPGWVLAPDGQSCVEDGKYTITLDSHIIHGSNSDPDLLYTWHNRGVYLYPNYTGEMTTIQNPLDENPVNYAIVKFYLNGQGASLIWDGVEYTNVMDVNVFLDFQGFWKSVNGSPRYIGTDGYITETGRAIGMAATAPLTWHAQWQPRALGTISPSGNALPEPTRPGYEFAGWFDTPLPSGGNRIYPNYIIDHDQPIYARWSDVIYEVKLVSDLNHCSPSNYTPTKLYEIYNVGWNRSQTGTFDPDLTLDDNEWPIPDTDYTFDGYYDAQNGGNRVIRPDGRVVQTPNYTDNNHTWYARCVLPNGPFTVRFICDTDEHVVQSTSVNYNANVTAPTVADANCTRPGHTFNKWKAVSHTITFNAGAQYQWGYHFSEDFVPNWVSDEPYRVTLDQNDATEPGVTTLYEKYDNWWSLYQSGNPTITQLSGSALPRKTSSNFRGYQSESGDWMGTYNSTTGVWTLPSNTTVTSNETWTAIWDECNDGEYWSNGICESCSKQTNGEYTHSDPGATSVTQCYKECNWSCTPNGCPGTYPTGMSGCGYENVTGTGIQYNVPGATCQLQGQPSFPQNSCQSCPDCCPMNITCNNGYDLVGCECRDNRYIITLDSNLYNDNGTEANPSILYTWFNHGVYRDYNRTVMMTPNDNPLASGTPNTFATVTLNGNGVEFSWHNQYGDQLQDNVDFMFDGFYDTTGAAIDPVIGIDRYITGVGQSIGTTAQNNQTWRASWRNGSVDLPGADIMSRDGYEFDGWWTACDGGTRVSMGNQTIQVSGDRTLCAHWSGKSYTVTYNCNSEDGEGGSATDNQLAYLNASYTVRENFIPCHKDADASVGRRYHEFENWKFNLNSNTYWPGDSILWMFADDNPTFNAHYKECPDGSYFDGSCKACPAGYDQSDVDADNERKCYKDCGVQCIESCPLASQPGSGVAGCIYPDPRPEFAGVEYNGSACNAVAGNCPIIGYYCLEGYVSTDNGCEPTSERYEITLDPNGGIGGQEKLYTIYNTGVYLDQARTLRMTSYQNYVTNVPEKTATATFNYCDYNGASCDGNPTTSSVSVDLGLKGYYQTATNNVRYLEPVPNINVLKLSITDDGDRDGKGYQDNTHTWYAQWSPAAVGSLPAPENHTAQCKTYTFANWWDAPVGGNRVYSDTKISENVTWYAHWCESCPASIPNGSCTETDCKATIACNNGYNLDETQCACVPTPGLTLTYDPNGGTANVPTTYLMTFGQTFTTLGDNDITKNDQVNCEWRTLSGGSFPELGHQYTYDYNGNTTLQAHWVPCNCDIRGNGVENCRMSVVNNACVPTVECKDRFITNSLLTTCTDDCNPTCTVSCTECPAGWISNADHSQCTQCQAGTYQDGNECKPCPAGFTSNAGAISCYGNTITIDWDENGGNNIYPNGFCAYCNDNLPQDWAHCISGTTNELTLADAPAHTSAEFQGWKLATGNDLYSAGTNVMCTYDNVGVSSGTSYSIQAQWNPCECDPDPDPNLFSCSPTLDSNGRCWYINRCKDGYDLDFATAFSAHAICIPHEYKAKYNCNGGTGTAPADDTVQFNSEYMVKANPSNGGCSMTGSRFVGWLFDGDNQIHTVGETPFTWIYTSDKNFTAQYSQCATGEIWVNGACEPCTCLQNNWSSGVASCVASPSSISTCSAVVTCETGYNNPWGTCAGATCSAQCDQIQSDAIYECGDGATGTPPATETMNYGATHTIKPNEYCIKSGHTFNGWKFSGNDWYYNAGAMVQWNYTEDKIFTGQWCENCGDVTNGSCSLDATNAGQCSYTTSCYDGYVLVSGAGTAHPVCEPDSSLKITYRPNGGVNPQTGNNQPVRQSVTYWDEFTTLVGTTFTQNNHILTRWDLYGNDLSTFDRHQDPDTNQYYAELNEYYEHYNTLGNTIFDAHWEQCTCDADNCTTYATDENKCACSATCPTGYTYGGCNCNGTSCAPTCNAKESDAIYVCGDGATGTPPAKQTMKYGATHTVQSPFPPQGNCSKTNYTFMNWAFTGDGDFHRAGDEIVWNYETDQRFTGQWCENCGDVVNGSCELGTVFAGSCQYTCSCEPGYKLVGECNAHPECKPDNTLVIHYESNNGLNQTYNQSVTYGQPFVTEGGTRFTKVNNIMTQWKVKDDVTTTTFPAGIAGLSGDYVYVDTTDTTLEAQWEQCTCNADGCDTYATDENKCACSATCPTGYTYGGCECNGTNCAPICTLGGSNANYVCGTGIGTGYSTYVNYGDTHTILTNAFVGCYRDNSTFAGWAFNGDNTIYFDNVGATVTWNYTAPKEFEAKWCDNCSVVEHGTNQLTIPEPGLCSCVLTCDTGYHVNSSTHTCEPNVYPNGITYKPNGGTPNQNYTQTVTYDAAFTTLDWSAEHYRKPRHIMTQWAVESGGAGTFDSGYAKLGWEYPYYKTDGATVLAADWTECAADRISLNNQCQQCQCTENEGVTSCTTSATNNDTCSCTGDCAAGYEKGGCNCDGITCTQSCSKCAYDQVSVNGHCTDCECSKGNNGAGIISGCGFVSNNGNICNWDPTTCELGYGYPDLTCTETDHNNNCTASCTICEAGYYGPNGRECLPCPDGKTSLPGATSIKECFISGCPEGQHIEHGNCVADERACSIPNATSAARIWNPAIGTYGPCTVIECDVANGYHESGNACVRDTCTVAHGSAESEQVGPSSWECFVTKCDPGYEPSSDSKSCVECANRYVDGDLAVSSYVSECEIAACMYQGQKYALEEQFGEKVCVPICTMDRFTREDPNNPTGTIQWDERTKKCIRTCKPGYKMW